MAVKPIIIQLIADPTGLQPGIDGLEEMGKVDKNVADQFRAANKAFQDRGKVLDESVTSTEKFAAASKKLVESIAGGAIAQATKNIETLNKQVDNTNADFLQLSKTIDLAKKQLASLQQGTPAFEKLSLEIEAAETAIGNFDKQATSSRAQLRQFREALTQLEEAGLENTQVFQDLAISAGQLDDQVGDTQARIKTLASDTFKFDAAIQAVQGLAGAFSIAQGAAALFGNENEEIQKTLLKVNAAMAILNGLQQIQQLLQKQSALSIATQVALQRIQVLQTNLQSAAESRFVVVRYAAAAAQRVLNAVMAANPAGVVLFAIAALATALIALTTNTDKAAKAQEMMNQELETFIKISELSSKVAKQQGDIRIAELEKQRASAQEIREAETDNLRQQVLIAQKNYDKATKDLASYGTNTKKLSDEQLKQRLQTQQIQQESAQKYFELENQLQVKRIQDQKKAEDESLASATAAAQARVAQTKKGSQEELAAQIDAIKVRQNQQLAAEGITEGERKQIIAENERAIADFRLQIQTKNLDDQISLAQAKALQQEDNYKSIQERIRDIVIKYEKDRIGLSKEQAVALEKEKNDAIIKVYQERRGAFQQFEEELSVIMLTAERDALGKNKEQTILIEIQKNEAIRQLRQKLFGDLEKAEVDHNTRLTKADDDRVLNSAKNAQELLAIQQKQAQDELKIIDDRIEKEKQKRLEIRDAVLGLALGLSQAATEIAQNQANAELAILQDRLDKGLISQEAYDKQVKAIRRRQATQEKQMALFQAIINTAAAVVKALPNIPLSVIAGILGAAQIAAIQSRPIPAFAKGTKHKPNSGPALIGEAGPELFYANGKFGYADKPTVLNLPKGAKVIPTLETGKILERYNIPVPNVQQNVSTTFGGVKIDYSKMAALIGKEIGKLPLQNNVWDGNGFSQYQISLSQRKSYLNKRYSSK